MGCVSGHRESAETPYSAKGHTPPSIHVLSELATWTKSLGAKTIDWGKLRIVPSGKRAADIRYEGEITLSQATGVCRAALSIIRQVVFKAGRDIKLDFREGRILMRRPPYFDFDTDEFSKQLRCKRRVARGSDKRWIGRSPGSGRFR